MWTADLENGCYKNPILYADYSDPDVIRVGEDFFMTASSFMYSPGLPILHSKDLVNWKVVNYAIQQMPFEIYDLPAHGKGVWAPSIRYYNGEFYIYFGAPDEGIFMVKTKDPFGKWEEPILVKEALGWIDTCPLWDEDGKAYLIHAFANSRCGIKSVLHINKMALDGKFLLDEGTLVIDGRVNHPTLEGPKFYKRNGYYYIFAPAGGVEKGWQVIFRSKNIYGPYEEKIVLRQGDTPINGPHQGGLVELENGESWFIHFQDLEVYGRVVHLQPVRWEDDWPLMGEKQDENGTGQPVLQHRKPNIGKEYPVLVPDTTDEFEKNSLGLQWQWQANWREDWYSLTERASHLRLYTRRTDRCESTLLYELPNVVTQMFQMPVFSAITKIELFGEQLFDQCGLMITGNTYHYLSLIQTEKGMAIQMIRGKGDMKSNMKGKEPTIEEIIESKIVNKRLIYLKVDIHNEYDGLEKAVGQFSYSTDGELFEEIGNTFYATPGGWVGAKIGLFATNLVTQESKGYADFDWIRISE